MSTIASLPVGSLARSASNNNATLTRRPNSGRPLASLLLAAAVAALATVANELIETWSDGHLLAAWVALWAVVFAGTMLLAGTARRLSQRLMVRLDAWARLRAQARAEARYLALARSDSRVMAELQAAQDRADAAAEVEAAVSAPAYNADAARSANVDMEIDRATAWARRYRNVYYV
jgi:low affinity Fe/Cu permease